MAAWRRVGGNPAYSPLGKLCTRRDREIGVGILPGLCSASLHGLTATKASAPKGPDSSARRPEGARPVSPGQATAQPTRSSRRSRPHHAGMPKPFVDTLALRLLACGAQDGSLVLCSSCCLSAASFANGELGSGCLFEDVLPNGLALAFITDQWGTYIELTEGLSKL